MTTSINGRWELKLPKHRARQWAEWEDGWEVDRLDATYSCVAEALVFGTTPPVVFDIGSETGDLPCLWAVWGCRVVMVEPSEKFWPTIRRTFEMNDVVEMVAGCFVGFAADNEGPITEYVPGPWPKATRGTMAVEPGFSFLHERPDIQRTTVDALAHMLDERPDVITIDVEGAEHRVLLGAKRTLERDRPVVLVSVHPVTMHEWFRDDPDSLRSMMAELSYDEHLLTVDHEEHWVFWPTEREDLPWKK